ncbi:MAG: hypothetical protein WC243_00045 [Patescibacteria group bacterium]
MSSKSELFKLKSELKSLEKHLNIAMSVMRTIEEEEKKAFEEIPGKTGTFDGESMVSESGERFPVPANYAAKSMLMFGDKMKMVEEDGKPFFKNIGKSEPKEIRGVLSKKEDVWYILADCGSYRISDTAALYHNAQQNVEATALIPADNLKVPFAALKIIKGEEEKKVVLDMPRTPIPAVKVEKKPQPKPMVAEKKPEVKKPNPPVVVEKKPEPKKEEPTQKKELLKTDQPIVLSLEDDDLR